MRGYLTTSQERINQIAAEEELRRTAEQHKTNGSLLSITVQTQTAIPPRQAHLIADYKTLGIKPGSSLDEVEAAWKRLALRADPKRFPSGSEEEKKAAAILDSINRAYANIREELNPTEGRFGKLEL